MTLHVFEHTDASAPQLTGEYGKLNDILNACLVDGYGAKAGAGWTRDFHDAVNNVSVFRQPVASKSRCYLRVNDNHTLSTGKVAEICGYESMTDVNTGTGKFHDSTPHYFWKSNTADTTVREWYLFADQVRFFLITAFVSAAYVQAYYFGDIIPDVGLENDIGRCAIVAHPSYSSYSSSEGFSSLANSPITSAAPHNCFQRTYTGMQTPIAMGMLSPYVLNGNTSSGAGSIPYPYPTDGSLRAIQCFCYEYITLNQGIIRGKIPGIWFPLHNKPLVHKSTIDGMGALAGRSFRAFDFHIGSYQILMETSDTWN